MLAVGWHFLESSYNGPPLPAATFLDPNEWGADRGAASGMHSEKRLCRIYFKGRPDPGEIAEKAKPWGARDCRVQIGNEQNHPIEEWSLTQEAFAAWFRAVEVRAPGVRLYWGFPSPGIPGWEQWLNGAEQADGIAVHAYGDFGQMRQIVEYTLRRFPGKPLWIAECNFGAGQVVDKNAWARDHFKPFLDWCAQYPAIEAVTYFAYRWPTPDMRTPVPVDGAGTEVERVLREWQPSPVPVPTPPKPADGPWSRMPAKVAQWRPIVDRETAKNWPRVSRLFSSAHEFSLFWHALIWQETSPDPGNPNLRGSWRGPNGDNPGCNEEGLCQPVTNECGGAYAARPSRAWFRVPENNIAWCVDHFCDRAEKEPDLPSAIRRYNGNQDPEPYIKKYEQIRGRAVDTFWEILKAEFGGQVDDLRGKLERRGESYGPIIPSQIVGIAVHQTGFNTTPDTTWEQVTNYHIYSNGWNGVGYHLGIRKGRVAYLRDATERGAHLKARNHEMLGLVFTGMFENGGSPSAVDLDLGRRVVKCVDKWLGRLVPVGGHGDLQAGGKACPGPALRAWAVTVRQNRPETGLEAPLRAVASGARVLTLNKSAGLQRRIAADGFWAASGETPATVEGQAYVAQLAEHPTTGEKRVYWVPWGQWDEIKWAAA